MTDIAIAIDLGGTQIRVALVDRSGAILERENTFTESKAGAETIVAQIGDLVDRVKAKAGEKHILGVGVSSPGPIDTDTGITHFLPTLSGFGEFPLRDALSRRLQTPVRLENDGISAAIGEWRFGAGKGLRNLVYVTVSTGIGGGVIVDNHVMRGRKGMAGHVGHMSIMQDGTRCGCGNLGCIEAYAAGPAFAARASKLLGKANLVAEDVFTLAKQGNATAQNLVADEARLLGIGFTSLLHLYSPDMLIMGGGLSNEFDVLYPMTHAYIQDNAMAGFKPVPLVKAKLGGNSGLIGAASLVFE